MGVFRCKANFYSIPLLSCVRESGSCSNGAADLTRKYYIMNQINASGLLFKVR